MMAKRSKVAKTAIAAVTASAVFLCGMGAGFHMCRTRAAAEPITTKARQDGANGLTYDILAWNADYPQLPSETTQDYYIIFSDGEQTKLLVFNADQPTDAELPALYPSSTLRDEKLYFLDITLWNTSDDDFTMDQLTGGVISSNISLYDDKGKLLYNPLRQFIYERESTTITGTTILSCVSKITNSFYILPDSNMVRLSDEDLKGFSPTVCILAEAEILACNGAHFSTPELDDYFTQTNWYVDEGKDIETVKASLNEIEAQNLSFISEYRNTLVQ